MKVLVAGATGQTGRRIVEQLLNQGIAVKALVRDLDKARALLPASSDQLEIVVGDVLKPSGLTEAMSGCQAVVSATGAAPSFDLTGPFKVDYVGTKNLVDTAKSAGMGQLVMVSSLCVSKLFHPLNLFWGVLFWKKQAEAYLKNSGLSYTIVRPGGLKNDDNTQAIVMSSADTLFEGSIPRQKVALVCIEALSQPAAKNKVVEIVTQADAPSQPVASLFERV